ncbi:hypothetical protein K503DRAFT_247247 [Rhizopogon vinicolor AM-OR11-026]|uniref:Uncharacterized protein n=1 Tax=Rhizopogon vinicolor AM-OR11-026 TaxID=1314800 RepID=A0A1B7MXC6_9AGAM|nr:hypothetical protein K503DRAFT_247247 [Rhizopogon vinicolor AM-OR11-026]
MLPITEFQFAFCGIATFAATFGYACARRASSRPPQTTIDVAPEEKTLKRKLDESDAESEEEQERPIKRSRTPPIDHEEEEAQNAAPHPEPTAGQELSTAAQCGTPQAEEGAASADEPPPAIIPQAPVISESVQPVQAEEVQPRPNEPESQHPALKTDEHMESRSVTPPPIAPKPVTHRMDAFSAFTNTQSPFAKYSNTPFPSSTSTSTPAWRCGKPRAPDVPAESADTPSPNDNAFSQSPNDIVETSSVSPLADHAPASTVPKTSSRASPHTTVCLPHLI